MPSTRNKGSHWLGGPCVFPFLFTRIPKFCSDECTLNHPPSPLHVILCVTAGHLLWQWLEPHSGPAGYGLGSQTGPDQAGHCLQTGSQGEHWGEDTAEGQGEERGTMYIGGVRMMRLSHFKAVIHMYAHVLLATYICMYMHMYIHCIYTSGILDLLRCSVLCCVVLCCAIWYSVVLCSVVLLSFSSLYGPKYHNNTCS